MSYVRSIPGQLLGYGRFIMESAGQDQAMRTVEWVPRPDETYRAICAVIFNIGPPPGTTTVVEIRDDGTGAGPPAALLRAEPIQRKSSSRSNSAVDGIAAGSAGSVRL